MNDILKLGDKMRVIPLDDNGKAVGLEPAYVELCEKHGVDPTNLHWRLAWRVDEGQKAELVQLSLGELKVLKACVEVAGGF